MPGVTKVIQEIGHLLGIESHDETFSDVQMSPLLTLGKADKSARSGAVRGSGGDMGVYINNYKAFQRDYRKKYSARFVESLGYAPSTNATWKVLNEVSVLSYVQTIDIHADGVYSMKDDYSSIDDYGHWHMQNIYGLNWNNKTRTLVNAGKVYEAIATTASGLDITVKLEREYTETIVENLTNNYQYDGTNVVLNTGPNTADVAGTALATTTQTVVEVRDSTGTLVETQTFDTTTVKNWMFTTLAYGNGTYDVSVLEDTLQTASYQIVINDEEVYSVGAIDYTIYNVVGVDNYKTVVTNGTSVDIYTPVEYLYEYTTDLGIEVLYVTYSRNDQPAGDWFVYLENLDTVPGTVYTSQILPMTAVIPLKENNTMVNLANNQLRRMLRKVNIDSDSLITSLENPDLDNAYIMTGLWPMETNPSVVKALYMTFDTFESGTVTTNISEFSMKTKFSIVKSAVAGQIQPVGTYSSSVSGSGSATVLTLVFQGSVIERRVIVISNYLQTYVISGQSMSTYLDGGVKLNRIILPLHVRNKLRYREFTDMYELSLLLVGYSTTTIRIKWYETGAFGVLLKIVAVVVAIVSIGTATTVSAALWAMAEAAAYAIAITLVLKALGPELGFMVVVLAIVASLVIPGLGFLSSTGTGFSAYLPAANTILSTANQALSMKTEEMVREKTANLDAIDAKNNDIEEVMKGLKELNADGALIMSFDDTYVSKQPNGVADPEQYIAAMHGEALFDYSQFYAVDYQIERRKQVQLNSA